MQHLRKIKRLNDERDKKMHAMTLMGKKSKQQTKKSKDNHSILQHNEDRQSFVIKNLDENKVQLIDKEDQVDKILKNVQQISIQTNIKQDFWWGYLSQKDKQQEIFLQACYQGSISQVLKIIKGQGQFPIQISLALTTQGRNGVHLAVMGLTKQSSEIIQLLYENKVNINAPTQYDLRTPLMIAAILGNYQAASKLLELGADINLQDSEGNTALHHAYIYKHHNIAEILINNKAIRHIKNKGEKIPFQYSQIQTAIKLESSNSEYNKFKNYQTQESIKERGNSSCTQNSDKQSLKKSVNQLANTKHTKVGLSSFRKISLLGKGAFGKVFLVQNTVNKKLYAMKSLDKNYIIKQNIIRYAMTERNVLSHINHPFIVKLHYAFQSNDELYLAMDYCPGGDMLRLLKSGGPLDEQTMLKYTCQIILALEELHRAQIIYRDLKPANVVIDKQGHACLTDFGLSKQASFSHSFCGSTAYLAPQMVWRKGHTKVIDWYLLGVLMYECLSGFPPYWNSNKQTLMSNIKNGNFEPLSSELSQQLRDLISKLLITNSLKRLGAKGSEEIKNHQWFKNVNWTEVLARKQQMPIVNQIEGKPVKSQKFDIQEQIQNFIEGWEYNPEQ